MCAWIGRGDAACAGISGFAGAMISVAWAASFSARLMPVLDRRECRCALLDHDCRAWRGRFCIGGVQRSGVPPCIGDLSLSAVEFRATVSGAASGAAGAGLAPAAFFAGVSVAAAVSATSPCKPVSPFRPFGRFDRHHPCLDASSGECRMLKTGHGYRRKAQRRRHPCSRTRRRFPDSSPGSSISSSSSEARHFQLQFRPDLSTLPIGKVSLTGASQRCSDWTAISSRGWLLARPGRLQRVAESGAVGLTVQSLPVGFGFHPEKLRQGLLDSVGHLAALRRSLSMSAILFAFRVDHDFGRIRGGRAGIGGARPPSDRRRFGRLGRRAWAALPEPCRRGLRKRRRLAGSGSGRRRVDSDPARLCRQLGGDGAGRVEQQLVARRKAGRGRCRQVSLATSRLVPR